MLSMSTFKEKLERALQLRGMSQKELGAALGVAQSGISNQGKQRLGVPSLRALAIARQLRVPLEWLVDPEMEGDPAPPTVLSPAEQAAVDIVRTHGLSKQDVIHIMTKPARPKQAGEGRIEVIGGSVSSTRKPDGKGRDGGRSQPPRKGRGKSA